MAIDRNEMARLHEEFLAELFGGRSTRGSGQTWQDPADGRNNRLTEPEFAFAWDGKSTRGKGITIERAMIAKIREQAGGERPAIGLRFYETDDLKVIGEDWVAVTALDFAELLAAARLTAAEVGQAMAEVRARAAAPQPGPVPDAQPGPVPLPALRGPYPVHLLPVPPHELWPCLVVDARREIPDSTEMTHRGYWIADDGMVSEYGVSTVRSDSGMGELRMYVNDVRVIRGQLYVDGKLELQVGGPAA